MRWLGLAFSTLALLSVPGCNDSPTSPDAAASFDKSFAGHSAGRLVVGGQIREGEWKISIKTDHVVHTGSIPAQAHRQSHGPRHLPPLRAGHHRK